MGDLTRDFSAYEFRCPHCRAMPGVSEQLLRVLQRARTAKGRPLRIVSGYRCRTHNQAVGGHRSSQHLFGRAADVPRGYATAAEWHSYGAIGVGVRQGGVVHVDVTPGARPFTFDD